MPFPHRWKECRLIFRSQTKMLKTYILFCSIFHRRKYGFFVRNKKFLIVRVFFNTFFLFFLFPKAPPAASASHLSSSKILPGETAMEHLKRLTSNMTKPANSTAVLKEMLKMVIFCMFFVSVALLAEIIIRSGDFHIRTEVTQRENCTIFFIGNLIFHLSLELLTTCWKMSLKVA